MLFNSSYIKYPLFTKYCNLIFKMATFGEVFELCKIPNGAELIGIEKHSEEDHFILTFKNKDVLVYNVRLC